MNNKVKVLEFWHQVEFFQSPNLADLIKSNNPALEIGYDKLDSDQSCLPWINRTLINNAGKGHSADNTYSYKLFLGIFKRSELTELAADRFKDDNQEWEERKDEKADTGETCSATVILDEKGCVQVGSFAFSTCPWALGKLSNDTLAHVSYSEFDREVKELKQRINDIIVAANRIKEEANLPLQLSTFEILSITTLLRNWSKFSPKEPEQKIIIQLFKKKVPWEGGPCLIAPPEIIERLQNLEAEAMKATRAQEEIKPTNTADESEISILNSFYIKDIERSISLIRNNLLSFHAPLVKFLADGCIRQADLLSPDGEKVIGQRLSIANTPLGRWPDADRNFMSMMQQFAINTIGHELMLEGLFSVNGPPGTGKTTMLRDLIADNLVKRAKVLAGLGAPKDAFVGEVAITVQNKQKKVKCLMPELTGFEMVVVSSNNTAVENITKELPQKKALGESYQHLGYFKPVAQKLASGHDFGRLFQLNEKDDCWGLIAAALGKKKNRDDFIERVFTSKTEKLKYEAGAEAYDTFWDYVRKTKDEGPSFKAAQVEFNRSHQQVLDLINQLAKFEQLAQKRDQLSQEEAELKKKRQITDKRALHISKLLLRRKPLFVSLLSLKLKEHLRLQAIINGLCRRNESMIRELESKKNSINRKLAKLLPDLEKMRQRFGDVVFHTSTVQFEDRHIQRRSFGLCLELNAARAQLTVDAFTLHQSWIKEALTAGFDVNVSALVPLLNGAIKEAPGALSLWKSLFMVVPVISSTFAAVERQFQNLKNGDIGWLFIDEAGQASPQQAVGALLRAKRAVVVGDPLQIEPVFTIPSGLVDELGREKLGESYGVWTPTLTSVQKLADAANPYGTSMISSDENDWLGSPLRVHRRCKHPMYSIANKIAYQEKMYHGEDSYTMDDHPVWGKSCWIDVKGIAKDKYVEAQGELVAGMICRFLEMEGHLPSVYVITPFRNVKAHLQKVLKQRLPKEDAGQWIKDRIGTVHTFQGKEEQNVIFCLGGDKSSLGAAKWAASKCNLLNVAVTRAKHHVYFVGDYSLWAQLDFFNQAAEILGEPKAMEDMLTMADSSGP